MTREAAILLFMPTEEERQLFPYIRKFGAWLDDNFDPEQPEMVQRLVLAGLFLTYRAYRFRGGERMDSAAAVDVGGRPIDRRLAIARDVFGVAVSNDLEYLRAIGALGLGLPRLWFDPGGYLIRFVKRARRREVSTF